MNKKQVLELKKYILSEEWIDWSCGRSTDYVDVFWTEGSIKNLINKIDEICGRILG